MSGYSIRILMNVTFLSCITVYTVGKIFYIQEPPSGESTTTECGVNYQLLAVIIEQPNGELIVAVYHNQLRTMASETVGPIDWWHPPPSCAVSPERLVHSINQCSSATAGIRSCNLATFSMRGNHLAYAAIQGYVKHKIRLGYY